MLGGAANAVDRRKVSLKTQYGQLQKIESRTSTGCDHEYELQLVRYAVQVLFASPPFGFLYTSLCKRGTRTGHYTCAGAFCFAVGCRSPPCPFSDGFTFGQGGAAHGLLLKNILDFFLSI